MKKTKDWLSFFGVLALAGVLKILERVLKPRGLYAVRVTSGSITSSKIPSDSITSGRIPSGSVVSWTPFDAAGYRFRPDEAARWIVKPDNTYTFGIRGRR